MPVLLRIMTSWLRIFVPSILSQHLCFVLSYFLFVKTPASPKMLEMLLTSPLCFGDQDVFPCPRGISILIRTFISAHCMEFPESF